MSQPDANPDVPSAVPHERDPSASRRRFLKWLIGVSFGAFGIAFALPALALRALSQSKQTIATGDVLVYATGGRAGQPVSANDLQLLQAAQAFPEGKESNQENLVELVRLTSDPTGLVAYSAICTHLGCTVLGSLNNQGLILCPCHGSEFDPAKGAAVVRGPANRPLPSLPITIGPDGTVKANGGFSGPVGPD
jgi:rieske iron-sulfur protein